MKTSNKAGGKSSSGHVGLDSGVSEHMKIEGCCSGRHVSGQKGGNNTPTKPREKVSANGGNFTIG